MTEIDACTSVSPEILAQIARTVVDAVIVVDGEKNIQYICLRQMPHAAEHLRGKSLNLYVSPQEVPALYEALNTVIAAGVLWQGTLTYRRYGEAETTSKGLIIMPVSGDNEAPCYALVECNLPRAVAHTPTSVYLEISQVLTPAQDSDELIRRFLHKARELAAVDAMAIGLLGDAPQTAETRALHIAGATRLWETWIGKALHCPAECHENIRRHGPLYLAGSQSVTASPYDLERFDHTMPYMLLVPLVTHDKVRGILLAGSREPISLEQQNTLHVMATMAVRALARQNLRQDLEHQVKLLKTAQDELVRTEKLASLGVLLAGVAHELNNPLTSIILYTQFALEHALPEDLRQDLQQVLKLAQRAAEVIRNMLDFAAESPAEVMPLHIETAIREALALIQHELHTRGIEVRLDIQPGLPQIIAAPVQIQQVLLNLLMTALVAIEARETQAGSSEPGRIEIGVRMTANEKGKPRVRVAVSDNGTGIAPEHLPYIFDPFFTTREPQKGTGLGLSICHSIVTRYGGRLWVESTFGDGATFYMELPAATPEDTRAFQRTRARKQAAPKAAAVPAAALHILIVDDEESIREVFARILQRAGYRTAFAADGIAAKKAILANDYDLILCDLNIPNLSGDRLYEQLAEEKPDVLPRIVFITGDIYNQRIREFMARVSNRFITKPFARDEFLETVWNALKALHDKEKDGVAG